MRPEYIPGATNNLDTVEPDKQDGRTVVPLYVREHDHGFVSQWRPSADELKALLAGAPIHLHILDCRHPAVWLDVAPATAGTH